jgi:hypothetical protein
MSIVKEEFLEKQGGFLKVWNKKWVKIKIYNAFISKEEIWALNQILIRKNFIV